MEKVFCDFYRCGVRSILCSGEGEPLLNKNLSKIVFDAKKAGLEVALATNGAILSETFLRESLGLFSWMKISIAAGTAENYAKIHRCRECDFQSVLTNLEKAVSIRYSKGFSTVIGAQMLLLPENASDVRKLATLCRDRIGLDYLVVKPLSQNEMSLNRLYHDIDYRELMKDFEELEEEFSGEKFNLIIRRNAIKCSVDGVYSFPVCHAVPYFWAHVDSKANVWACGAWVGDDRFLLGNLRELDFESIWLGEKRRQCKKTMEKFDVSQCRQNCRMRAVNEHLQKIMQPPAHFNFI